ncbi:Glycerol-3-phosphate dehydrogenase [NAD+], cytoplasmic, partial [Ophiophagus hannah]
ETLARILISRWKNVGETYLKKEGGLHLCLSSCCRGSAIAKIVGSNAARLEMFDTTVKMWVFEEEIAGQKLTEIINTQHENVKYLPGHKLPPNVVAVPDVLKASADADILIFVVPHQFIGKLCEQMKGHIKKEAIGISLIKGVDEGPDGLKLISDIIREQLGIEMSVLMGANIANEVAEEKFCETTIGCKNLQHGQILKELMQTPNFRITVVQEADTVEICGALKNVVAVGAGFCRNRKVAEAFAKTGKSIEQLENEMLHGQKLQGPQTSAELHHILKPRNLTDKFPLFTAVYEICYKNKPVSEFITCLQAHPEHL